MNKEEQQSKAKPNCASNRRYDGRRVDGRSGILDDAALVTLVKY